MEGRNVDIMKKETTVYISVYIISELQDYENIIL